MTMGEILLVIPPTVRTVRGNYEVEDDCVNNLEAYLENFEWVTFACPSLLTRIIAEFFDLSPYRG